MNQKIIKLYKNNKFNEKNIHFTTKGKYSYYIVKVIRDGILNLKYFKTLEEAISYRDTLNV
jgi:hypothetical protein